MAATATATAMPLALAGGSWVFLAVLVALFLAIVIAHLTGADVDG